MNCLSNRVLKQSGTDTKQLEAKGSNAGDKLNLPFNATFDHNHICIHTHTDMPMHTPIQTLLHVNTVFECYTHAHTYLLGSIIYTGT